jgi:hypothetical protein
VCNKDSLQPKDTLQLNGSLYKIEETSLCSTFNAYPKGDFGKKNRDEITGTLE